MVEAASVNPGLPANEPDRATLLALLQRQQQAYLAEQPVAAAVRIDRMRRAIALLQDHAQRWVEAMNADFGHRSADQSMFTDVASSVGPLQHSIKHLHSWMKPERRSTQFPLGLLGAKAHVEYQPLGVVGVISPWNFPVNLTFTPLAGIFAAGNRAMIKPSEFTPATSALMAELFPTAFDQTEVTVVTGGPQVGADFAGLPFDHLLFTGATSIAHHVMRAAADNLVPVTLELGGKSPVVIGRSADIEQAAMNVMQGKTLNAGQICLAPDYVMVPNDKKDAFVAAAQRSVAQMYPTLLDNDDYTSVINQRHYDRLQGYLDDAREQGAQVLEINPAGEDFRQQPHLKMPPTLVLDPTDDMQVMQDEIFGPILPVKGYSQLEETIGYVNDHARPLGLYYFGADRAEERQVLDRTTSGGVTVNDVIMHIAQEDLPFGGVGPSGTGSYHGKDGFRRFSHARAVYRQARFDVSALAGLRPPYGEKLRKTLKAQLGK